MSDRGAKALFEAMTDDGWEVEDYAAAAAILGTTGLFIADVTKHEPDLDPNDPYRLRCVCGWNRIVETESYFDHIVGAP